MPVRLFSVDEANALLGPLSKILDRAQALMAEMRSTRDQLVDLRIIWGEKILDPKCPDAAEYEAYREKFSEIERQLQAATDDVSNMGCELKDLEHGLVDFSTPRGEEVVCLCWRKGERRIQFWHSMADGFAGRQSLEMF